MTGLFFPHLTTKQRVVIASSLVAALSIFVISLSTWIPVEVREPINAAAWVVSNVILAYSAVVLVVFLAAYFWYFDPRATTGGRLIFQFMLSLVGIISLNVISVFIDPSRDIEWYIYPDDVEPWRPVVRFVIYAFVAYAISSLSVLLVFRKWFPQKLKKASDITLVKVRIGDKAVTGPVNTPMTVASTAPTRILRKNPVIPTDLIEETWPNKRDK